MAVKAMQQGCFNFIEKPYDPQKMLDLVFKALRIATSELDQTRDSHMFEARFDLLSNREKEILREVVKGKRIQDIAYEFGIRCKTVTANKSRIKKSRNNIG